MTQFLRLLRVKHWIKNLFLFAAPFFGGKLFLDKTVAMAIPVFLSFSLGASFVYIFNDINDIEQDKLHPNKKTRPIASGRISKRSALSISILLAIAAFVMSYFIPGEYFYLLLLYVLIQVAYTLFLKDIPVVDIFCISSGFIIRVLAGGAAFNVAVSHWLLMTMFMISLVLASGKRLGEVDMLDEVANDHRKSLFYYSPNVLKNIFMISASSSLIAYSLYTVEQSRSLVLTIPIVTFGLFRYLMLSDRGFGDPTEALTKDKWLAATVIVWLMVVGIVRYV
jgi:decaprenyl-phosphate phosphoribosyltransferase